MTTTTRTTSARVHRPGPTSSPTTFSGHPGRPVGTFPSSRPPTKDPDMPTTSKTKPEPVEDEREAARRALQTSMDTRQ